MLRFTIIILAFLFQPLLADDVLILNGSRGKPLSVRVSMSSDDVVEFVRMRDGMRFVRELEKFTERDQRVIKQWKANQRPVAGSKKEGSIDFNSEEKFHQAWESSTKRKSGDLNAASSRSKMIRVEVSYGKKLAEVSNALIATLDLKLHHESLAVSVEERERLEWIIQQLKEVTMPVINENLKVLASLNKDEDAKRSLRADPIRWPEQPLFPARGRLLNQVPHVKQLKNYCGPATAEMLLRYCGLQLNQRQLARRFSERSAQHHGTYRSDMVREMLKLEVPVQKLNSKEILGYTPEYPANMSENEIAKMIKKNCFEFIKKKIDSGSPIITTVKHGRSGIGHFVCVIGYDHLGENPVVIYRDPVDNKGSKPKQRYLQDFVKYWIYEDDDESFSLQAIAIDR